jgi:hypothetical protein
MLAVDQNLEILMTPGKRKLRLRRDPHPLKAFFKMRDISQEKIAKLVGYNQGGISQMLSNQSIMTPKIEAKLFEVQQKILDWEATHHKKFGT